MLRILSDLNLVQIIWFSCPDFFLETVWSRQNPDLNLDSIWTILKNKTNLVQTESGLESGFCLDKTFFGERGIHGPIRIDRAENSDPTGPIRNIGIHGPTILISDFT